MAEQTTPLVTVDPNQSVKQNIVRLINQTNDTDLSPGDLTIVSIDLVDDQDLAKAEVTVEGVVESGYRGQKTIAYRRVKLSVLQNLIGYYALGRNETFEDVVKKVESQVGLAPGLLQQKADTPLAINQRATFELTDPNNPLYCHDLSFPVVDSMPHCPYGPQKIIQGDQNLGFYGEIQASELIEPRQLIEDLGIKNRINNGNLNNTIGDMDTPWLKLAYEGDIYFAAKRLVVDSIEARDFHYNLSLDHTRDVTIEGLSFQVVGLEDESSDMMSWLVDSGIYSLEALKNGEGFWTGYTNSHWEGGYGYYQIGYSDSDFDYWEHERRSSSGTSSARDFTFDYADDRPKGWRPFIRFVPDA